MRLEILAGILTREGHIGAPFIKECLILVAGIQFDLAQSNILKHKN